jgi:hypothetical protein
MQTAKTKRAAHRSEGPRLALSVSGVGRHWVVGDLVNVRLGEQTVPGLVIEDRGNLGPSGTQVVRVELQGGPAGDGEQFEVPASALQFKLKVPGTGHGRSANLALAREQAAADARTWVLREFDADDRPTREWSFSSQIDLEQELQQLGLNQDQRQSLIKNREIVIPRGVPTQSP